MDEMQRVISPPLHKINQLRQPLTPGERLVLEVFNKYLPAYWEIYIQPYLNGLRPDFVILNPKVGLAIFEVKDWNLDAMEYSIVSRAGASPVLYGKKDGRKFSLQHQNPVDKIQLYNKEMQDLYCPRLDCKSGYVVTTTGIIFPFANEDDIERLFGQSVAYYNKNNKRYNPISGRSSYPFR